MGLAAALWLSGRRKRQSLGTEASDASAAAGAGGDAAAESQAAIEVLLGRSLSQQWTPMKPVLSDRIAVLRSQQEKASGFAFPAVVFQDGVHLDPNGYEICIFGARHAQAKLYAEKILAIRASTTRGSLPGTETRDPAFGLPAVWIEPEVRERAQAAGYTLVDPVTILITHLGEVLRQEASLLLSRADVAAMLEEVRGRQPGLVEELIPSVMTISDVQRILQNLLAEDVSIRNIDLIAEALVDVGRQTRDHGELTELVRQRLSHGICHSLRSGHDQLAVLSLNPRIEAQIADNVRRSDGKGAFVIDPHLAEQLMRQLMPLAEKMIQHGLAPVLLCGPEIRRNLKVFTRRTIPRLAVLSVNEVPATIDLRSFDVVTVES
jgi:flagellar biosynthesis protein FlhA